MPYYATVPDSMRERLAELAALLRGCRDTYLRIDEDHHWMVHPSSAAASDLAVFAGTVGRRRLFAEFDDGGRRAQTIRLDGVEWLTSLAAMGIYDALSSVYQYCGWEFDIDSEFETMIDRTLPGFLWPSP
ncbi:hypothetical protein [Nocardia sp. NBC_00403]|uniref:hypothetical protein n=1 Tax=Nocardia sp. NBC_00403 TaxID=2975990 RepID=UPI002E2046A1